MRGSAHARGEAVVVTPVSAADTASAMRSGRGPKRYTACLVEATVFPQPIGVGSTWGPELVERRFRRAIDVLRRRSEFVRARLCVSRRANHLVDVSVVFGTGRTVDRGTGRDVAERRRRGLGFPPIGGVERRTGKDMLGALPDERVDRTLDMHGLPERTPNTITDRAALFEGLATIEINMSFQ